jgi:hypothetical protein
MYADDYRDMRRLKDEMYDQVRLANTAEFKVMYHAIGVVAAKYHLVSALDEKGQPRRLRIVKFLEENFGTLEEMEKGASWL